ncbi:single-stranded-DNA-specific exonuclease RecJ [Candidatus Clostridium radicumherbarum]|uniref:Single-stranded-DNA-specific exonuclease RecJ n=1 Tax=Candidatus Clostridium radicumherbarum TaxID=3381662 RepID=A0ABW8TVS2_9CLOT
MKEKWLLRQTKAPIIDISKGAGIDVNIAAILANRGIKTEKDMIKFMNASLDDLYDPFLMKDMDKGIEIIIEAIKNKNNIVVYGDYDVDGVTSTVILYKALLKCSAKVSYYVPHRENEGYGINSERIKSLKEEGAEVIITCDNGISAIEQISLAKQLGLKVVITDHHEVSFVEDKEGTREYIIPQADAVINPKQKDCSYPFKLLCGAGIALKFSTALYNKMNIDLSNLLELIEIAGIGTICDVVDLIDENRIIAKNALISLKSTKNIGLDALMEVLGIKDRKLNAGTIGFQIGPCINATGRLETAALSVDLLLSEEKEKAKELAIKLSELNKKRQNMTTKDVEEIIEHIETTNFKNDKVMVIYKEDVHESIAGIVAGKIKEKYNVPTIVITSGKEMPKGSGRSIEGYNLFEELLKCKDLIEKFGGHPMAAGLSIKKENIELLRNELNKNCKLNDDDIMPKLRIDKRIPVNKLSEKFIYDLEKLEPFGKGNETPVFAEKNIIVDKIYIIGKESNVLKLSLKIDNTNFKMDGICFGKIDEFKDLLKAYYGECYLDILENYNYKNEKIKLDLIYYPNLNNFNGVQTIQIKIIAFRLA